jgi:putative oxidoreductase
MSLADKFNLLNEFNVLRIICAVFFIPHIVGKITVPATLEFFVKAGFKPPATWMYIAGTIETVLCIGLFFGIYLQYVAFIAFIHLLVAAAATYKVTKSWIACSGRSVVSSLPCTLSMPASEIYAVKGSPPNG